MKKLLAAAAALIVLTVTANAQPLNQTQDYRIWSAERMIERITDTAARTTAFCKQLNSQTCQEAVIRAYPILHAIRNVAANGDDVDWARLVDGIHKFEKDINGALNR